MEKLDEILINTNEIKNLMSKNIKRKIEEKEERQKQKEEEEKAKKEKKEKEANKKESIKKAQDKFYQIKTNVNEELKAEIDERLELLGLNYSSYLQVLIKDDLNEVKQLELDNLSKYLQNRFEGEKTALNDRIDILLLELKQAQKEKGFSLFRLFGFKR